MSILEKFQRLFGDAKAGHPAVPVQETGLHLRLRSKEFIPIPSKTEGEFTVFAGSGAIDDLHDLAGLSLEEMQVMPTRVLSKCRELGLAHNEPVHFFLETQEIAHEPTMTVTKIVPPMDMGNGIFTSRTIHIFVPTVRAEIESTMNYLQAGSELLKANKMPREADESLAAAPKVIKAKYKMMLSHEMVHIFATDEHRRMMEVLGLNLLELLTDSINLVTFYPDYRKASLFVKAGVWEGIGYLANLLMADYPGQNPGVAQLLDRAHERAKKIIQQCREKMAV